LSTPSFSGDCRRGIFGLDLNSFTSLEFSIRDLLLVTAIAALALGWSIDSSGLRQEIFRLEMRARIRTAPLVFRPANDPAEFDPTKEPLING
jgi:hypothetical protein